MFFFVSIQFCRVVVVIDKQMSQRQLNSWFISSPFAQRWKIKYKTLRYLGTSSVRMYQSNRRLLRMICPFWTFKSLCRSFSSFFLFWKMFSSYRSFFLVNRVPRDSIWFSCCCCCYPFNLCTCVFVSDFTYGSFSSDYDDLFLMWCTMQSFCMDVRASPNESQSSLSKPFWLSVHFSIIVTKSMIFIITISWWLKAKDRMKNKTKQNEKKNNN